MKNQQLVRREGSFRVGSPFVVREFDFVGAIQEFHDRAYLAAYEALSAYVRQKCDDVEQARCCVHCCRVHLTKQLVSRGVVSPRCTIHVLLTTPEPR